MCRTGCPFRRSRGHPSQKISPIPKQAPFTSKPWPKAGILLRNKALSPNRHPSRVSPAPRQTFPKKLSPVPRQASFTGKPYPQVGISPQKLSPVPRQASFTGKLALR
ncbi:UNVERIFIED_CONTAM: hypothetical protein Sradi_7034600 [Sesamum radiatum]|uniref:Uncharacterized protein n=1 Tax=Sesamum radiatum TaxID=300843 RepID=A0AAW2J9H5_SESRA